MALELEGDDLEAMQPERMSVCVQCYLQRTNTGRSIYSLVSMYMQVYLSTHIYSSDMPLILYCIKLYIKKCTLLLTTCYINVLEVQFAHSR